MKKKIKIVFFIDSFMIGGMHRQILYLVKNINKDLFEPIVITTGSHGGLKDCFIETKCKLYDLSWKGGFDLKISYRLGNVLKLEKPQLIFISEPQNLIYYRLSKLFYSRRIIQVGSFRAMTFWLGHLSWKHKIIDDLLVKLLYFTSDEIVVNSQALKKHYSSILRISNKKNIQVIYNGSDFDFESKINPHNLRKKLGFSSQEILIVMVARLDPWKDFDTLFESAKILLKEKQSFKIILVGDGELKEDLKIKIKILNIENNVLLLGEKTNVVDYINIADVVVLSTFGEGFSNSILEAMALAKPVIATNVGGNPELLGLSGESGILISSKSPVLFAVEIRKLIENPKLRFEIGQCAKEKIYNLCNIKDYVNSYEFLFQNSVNKFKVKPNNN